jgi:hypothetical protein
MSLGCGEISNDPNGLNGRSGSSNAGAAGAAGRGGSGGSSTQMGVGGSAMADAGAGGGAAGAAGAAGGSMEGAAGAGAPQLPADCPEITPNPVEGQTIVLRSLNFLTSEMVLQNVSDTTQTIVGGRQGWQWCNFPAYWAISEPGDVELSPGETFAFIAVYNTTGPRIFDPEGGEMGIYTTTGSFTTADLMRAFVSWGDVLPQREATAAAGGYWVFDERIEIGAADDGFVIVGDSDRASGYEGVRAACLVAPPNEDD